MNSSEDVDDRDIAEDTVHEMKNKIEMRTKFLSPSSQSHNTHIYTDAHTC